jgi:hypothetical protein
LVEPILIIVIGLALGLVDQTASDVSGVLRVPALIAALILVGQGLNLLDLARQPEAVDESAGRVAVGAGAPGVPGGVNRGIDPDAEDDGSGSAAMARAVLLLAIWLGLATLAYPTAPVSLVLLSLLAAYLLFARGWKLMAPPRR